MRESDIKKMIKEAVLDVADKYKKKYKVEDLFLDPIIGYASAKDPLFEQFYERDWTKHPKEIYRPGNTVIVHFLPFTSEVVESNRNSNEISDKWTAAYNASILFSAKINDSIIKTLEVFGRLSSLTNLPGDWDTEKDAPEWSHKLAAYVAGMGDFGISGSFNTTSGSSGRFGSVITEFIMEPSLVWPNYTYEELNKILDEIENSSMFGNAVKSPPENKIMLCPADAISPKGVDKESCRGFCRGLKQIVPAPDVCGKCFD